MSDIREALVARQREEYGESWDVLVPEVGWTLGRIIESVIEDALSDVTPRGERVKPSVEVLADALAAEGIDAELRAEVERLRGVERGWQHDRSEWEKERDEAQRQLADLRAGIEALAAEYEKPNPSTLAYRSEVARAVRALSGSGEQLFERDDSCGYCGRVHSDFAACFEDAPGAAWHDHEWQRRQNVTSSGYRMTPYEVCVVDGCDAARQLDEPPTPRGEDQWWESLVEAPCDQGHQVFIDDGDGGVYACPACAPPPTVKPSVEALADALAGEGIDAEPGDLDLTPTAERLLALLPGRTEAEVKAEALREAASAAVTEGEGIPWNHDYDRATVGAWLEGRADYIEKEAEHG